jgi:hypothetical protein
MAMIPTRHEITGHEAEFPEDTIPVWRARGWTPLSEIEAAEDAPAEPKRKGRSADTTDTTTPEA